MYVIINMFLSAWKNINQTNNSKVFLKIETEEVRDRELFIIYTFLYCLMLIQWASVMFKTFKKLCKEKFPVVLSNTGMSYKSRTVEGIKE